ncbi:sulfatase-like hydrolase/transferase [Pedobacter sp. LMG 31462]|uniref:Sulfatase-like hydrolase/transferase n=2 Tax=Pedobacter gandavensis TaxID=2679963 RepID=A0ABR6ETX8_9SPHI|nr:sulfatase-like hydrolase/transferase [Pedobacter gandavensis]
MFRSLIFLLRFYIFWLLFFFIDRLIFLLIYHKKLAMVPLSETMATFYHALLLDLSMTAYLAVIPVLGFIFWLFSGWKSINIKWVSIYNLVLLVLFSILSVVNFNIYREWGTKVNAKAIDFAFSSPGEALASGASSPIALSLFVLVLLITVGVFLQKRLIPNQLSFEKSPIWLRAVLSILIIVFSFMFIRGGFKGSPITQSMSYFSEEQLLNHAAVNTEWNLIRSLLSEKMTRQNPYIYLDPKKADQLIQDLYVTEKDSTTHILTTDRPNVVMVIIESFTADLTHTLGNEEGITPHFDSLMHKGVLFDRVYSPGSRTDKGIIASLAGFPTLAAGSIVRYPEKMQKLPAISSSLAKNGYHTSFYYGGESEFDNYKAFILSHHYQKLIDKNNFSGNAPKSFWGQYDEAVFDRQLQELSTEKQPFYSTLLTLTNHEPYTLPGKHKFGNANNVEQFKSTAYYTDSCINAYLNNAKKQPWYNNTLFIFVADHGHVLPKQNADISSPSRYHIPLVFFGEVIKKEFRGKKYSNVASQVDIAATLLGQLNIPAKDFNWSKNLLNPYTKPFAYFSWDNGMGFIDNQQCVTFDNVGKMTLFNSNDKDKEGTEKRLDLAKAYLQKVYQQFIAL